VLYLATASTEGVRDAMRAGFLGQMATPLSGNRLEPGVPWELDNGCFSNQWSDVGWRRALERYADVPGCLFAVVPDVVADAEATDDLWTRWVPVVREHGYPAAYVLQNGCRRIPPDADAVFTGGDTAWKLGTNARRLVGIARTRGLWCHMGRVNSLRRLRLAAQDGYDSVDGTFLAFGPDKNLPRLLAYLRRAAEPSLFAAPRAGRPPGAPRPPEPRGLGL
jgi:hypothetical protein